MKKGVKQVFSLLLAAALALGLCAGAFALSTAATAITLNQSSALIYIRNGVSEELALTAAVQPSDFSGHVHWDYPEDGTIILRSSEGNSVRLVGSRAGEATVTASVPGYGGQTVSASCRIRVVVDEVEALDVEKYVYNLCPGGSAQINVVTRYRSGYEEKHTSGISFSVERAGAGVVSVNSAGLLTGIGEGSATVNVYLGTQRLGIVTVVVRDIRAVNLTPVSLSLPAGDSAVLSTSVVPGEITDYELEWATDNPSIVSFDASEKRVTGLRPGKAIITATVSGSNGVSASCTVTVTNPTASFTRSVSLDQELPLRALYQEISAKFTAVGGDSGSAKLRFSTVGNANYGGVYLSASSTQRADNGYEGALSAMDGMVFIPAGEGNYEIRYSVSDNYLAMDGTITIQVTVVRKSISFSVDGSTGYSFSELSKENVTAAGLIAKTVGAYGSIRFGSVSAGTNVGTLYLDETQARSKLVGAGTVVNSLDMQYLYFVPSRDGVYQINYTAYSGRDGAGSAVAGGLLSIQVGEGNLGVTVVLDGTEPYSFGNTTSRSADTGANMLVQAIRDTLGSASWGFVRFSLPNAGGASVGTLYESASSAFALSPETMVPAGSISGLYFVPRRSGNYDLTYSVFASRDDSAPLMTGLLRITVPTVDFGSVSIWYSTYAGGAVTFQESDFISYYQRKKGNSYRLSHVVFTDYDREYGTFYCDGVQFTPYNSADYYTTDFISDGGSGAKYLSRVSFAAENGTGYQVVHFTCYGNTASQRGYSELEGVLYIFVTAGEVPPIRVSVAGQNAVSLTEDGFLSAYQSAMQDSSARPQFYIQFLNAPSLGELRYNYRNAANSGVRITDSNRNSYKFYCNPGSNATGAGKARLTDLSYLPSNTYRGTDSVSYIAFNASGKELFTGYIRFQYGDDKTYFADSAGYVFSMEEFYSALEQDPVRYVTFRQPTSGKLYVNYANGRGTAVSTGDRFYTAAASDGKYPLTGLCFIPRAGSTGEAVLECTVTARSGQSHDETVRFTLNRKTASDIFSDVTARDVGTWAADSIDYAARWGLVNGTSTTGAREFSPNRTMQRCDLVLILYRVAGSPAVSGSMPYTDVPAEAYFYQSALWAARNNIMDSVAVGTRYAPNGDITRQDFVTILYNFTRYLGVSTSFEGSISTYKDVSDVSSYALRPMAWAVAKGYVTSTSAEEKLLSPLKTASRAEIATLLHRYLTY